MSHGYLPGPEERDGFRFRGGSLPLDLTATLAGRLKPAPKELLDQPEDLSRWLVAAGLCLDPPAASPADVDLARELREAIYALATSRIEAAAAAGPHLETLNRLAASPAAVPQLREGGAVALVGSTASLLALVAREAVELLGGPEAARIRQCGAESCTLLFIDRSRKHDRRWCSMAGCGNKAKVESFRRRRRDLAAPAAGRAGRS
jgi:predicted RNA-binding Zn ribbon-like protein